MNHPIVFLDVDGVLVTPASAKRPMLPTPGSDYKHHQFARHAVDALNRVTTATGAVMVLSSTWRITYWPSFLHIARQQGVTGTIIGRTPYLRGERGREIQAWLDAHGGDSPFVILDDEVSDMGHLMPRVVQTTWYGAKPGLRIRHAKRAIALLTKDEPW